MSLMGSPFFNLPRPTETPPEVDCPWDRPCLKLVRSVRGYREPLVASWSLESSWRTGVGSPVTTWVGGRL